MDVVESLQLACSYQRQATLKIWSVRTQNWLPANESEEPAMPAESGARLALASWQGHAESASQLLTTALDDTSSSVLWKPPSGQLIDISYPRHGSQGNLFIGFCSWIKQIPFPALHITLYFFNSISLPIFFRPSRCSLFPLSLSSALYLCIACPTLPFPLNHSPN